tara:strand:- start:478 stop:690 length:213 start_codon:yes stop_codon:yes gene_type:complete
MYNYDTIIKQLEAMTPAHQDEFAQKLIEENSSLAVTLSTKINIAHQDKYYTNSPEMVESLESRGHYGSSI